MLRLPFDPRSSFPTDSLHRCATLLPLAIMLGAIAASPAATQEVLLDQPLTAAPGARGGLISTIATGGASATQIATGFSLDDSQLAESVEWWGGHDQPTTDPATVVLELRLFDDVGGLPATTETEAVVLEFDFSATGLATGNGDAIYAYSATLDPPLALFSGAQWISIVEVAPTPGDWLWVSADEVPVSIADRFGTDASPWTAGLAFRGNRALRLLPEPGFEAGLAFCILGLAGVRRSRGAARRSRVPRAARSLLCASIAVAALVPSASAITYAVDLVVTGTGVDGTVVGTIETDDTLGALNSTHIVGFDLAVSTGSTTTQIASDDQGVASAITVTLQATADELIWPRTGNSAGEFSFCNGNCSTGNPRWRLTGGGLMIIDLPGEAVVSQGFPIGAPVTLGTASPTVPIGFLASGVLGVLLTATGAARLRR